MALSWRILQGPSQMPKWAYGFRLGKDVLLTPYTEVVLGQDASTYGAGLRYALKSSLDLDLKGSHRNRANGNKETRVMLQLRSDL